MILPLNDYSEKLFYKQRMIIDTKVDVRSGAEPRAWEITKVNRIAPSGLTRITLAQTNYDEHKDYIEYLDDNNPSTIVGMWADYYIPSQSEPQAPEETEPATTIYSKIIYTGVNPTIKVGGSYKTFTIVFYNQNDLVAHQSGHWTYKVDNIDVSSLLIFDSNVADNQVRFKFIDDDEYIDKTLLLSYITDDGKVTSSLEIGIVGM